MSALTAGGEHRFYNTKNLYGLSETIATQSALYVSTGKRGAIISRSEESQPGYNILIVKVESSNFAEYGLVD